MKAILKSLTLLGILTCTGPLALAATAPVLEMIGGSASVAVKREGKTLQLKKGDSLQAGDELTTDRTTAVDIRLEDKTLIRVGANSSYRLEEDSGMHKLFHRLLGGIVRVLVPKKDNPNGEVRFQMKTGEGTIGVRGTEFVVIQGGGQTKLRGLEGEVMFGAKDADFAKKELFVGVKKGFESSVAAGAAKAKDPTAYDLDAYLKELNSGKGPFGPLSARGGAVVKARSQAAPVVAAPVAAPVVKPSNLSKAVAAAPKKKKAVALGNPNEELFMAASLGDLKGIDKALKAGADISYPNKSMANATPLHIAIMKKQEPAVEKLLKEGAKADARTVDGRTPLMTAAEVGHPMIFGLVFDADKNHGAKDSSGATARDIAVAADAEVDATDADRKKAYKEILELIDTES